MPRSSNLRLGKLPAKHDPRTLRFAKYADKLAPAPLALDYTNRISGLGMLANDTLGDCTAAGAAHMHQAWCAYNGVSYVPTDADTIAFYSETCGYVPGEASTDNGGVLLDVLKYWRNAGFAGRKIEAFTSVSPVDISLVKQAIYYFGGLYMGVMLPTSAQDQDVWDVPWYGARGKGAAGSWGGHCVAAVVGYDAKTLTIITWGQLKNMTWKFFLEYCDEAYAVLASDWFGTGIAPTGFDVDSLRRDIQLIAA